MFRTIISPILRSTRLCLQVFHLILVTSRQHRRCIRPQALKHSLVLLRMGEIIAPKHVELIEIINKIITVAFSWLFIL